MVLGVFLSALAGCGGDVVVTLLMLIPLCLYPLIRKGKKLDMLIFVLLFVFGECIAEYMPFLSFPWSGLWLSVISQPFLTQPAALLGCRFVSLIIIAENCFITSVLHSKNKKTMLKSAAVFSLILFCNVAYSTFHISRIKRIGVNSVSIKAMAAQDNVEGRDKDNVSLAGAVDTYVAIMESGWSDDVKLAVLPETANSGKL